MEWETNSLIKLPHTTIFVHVSGQCQVEVADEEKEYLKLQKAIEEMRRLDEILSAKICKEKEVKRQRKELQAKLWQEFLVDIDSVFTLLTVF